MFFYLFNIYATLQCDCAYATYFSLVLVFVTGAICLKNQLDGTTRRKILALDDNNVNQINETIGAGFETSIFM